MNYKELDSLIKQLEEARLMALSMYQSESESDFNRYFIDLALKLEYATSNARKAILMTSINYEDYVAKVTEKLEITVTKQEDGIHILLPRLLPKQRSVESDRYLAEPLSYALRNYVLEHKPRKIEKAVITIKTLYGEDNKTSIRDTDNVEIHHLINTISSFLLVDDNETDIYLCSRKSKKTCTEIIVAKRE